MFMVKLKAWLRHVLAPEPVMLGPQLGAAPTTVEEGAQQLVERARQGDQNAIAMICQVRDNAKKGIAQARQGYTAIESYIKAHPAQSIPSFGEELANNSASDSMAIDMMAGFGEDYIATIKDKTAPLAAVSIPKAVVTLANGPSLLPSGQQNLVHDIRDSLDEAQCAAFLLGLKHGLSEMNSIPEEQQWAFVLGHVLGTARKIQAVRCPNVPLSILSPQLGAEFQERR
jgi:hypothetical protein